MPLTAPRFPAGIEPAPREDHRATRGERRGAPRYHFRVPVQLIGGALRGTGMVRDMSASGARIEETNAEPAEGAHLQLDFSFFAGSTLLSLSGKVVRATETGGFAVRFTSVDERKQVLLRVLLPQAASARSENEAGTRADGSCDCPVCRAKAAGRGASR